VIWHPLNAFSNADEHLAALARLDPGMVAVQIDESSAVIQYVVFPRGQAERDAFLNETASNAALSTSKGARTLDDCRVNQLQERVGGGESASGSRPASPPESHAITPESTVASNGHRRREQTLSPEYQIDLQIAVGVYQVADFRAVCAEMPSRTPGALRRALGLLVAWGALLRAHDATGRVWYALDSVREQVDALLGPRPVTVVDIALGLAGRVWTPAQIAGLEAILGAAGFVTQNGVVSSRRKTG
jgi:hypothetical protein